MRLVAFSLLVLLVAGCGPSNDKVVGKWSGNLTLSEEDMARAPATSFSDREKVRKEAESKSISLEVREDGTYTLVGYDGFPVTDTWVIKGNQLVLASSGSNPSVDEKEGDKRYPNQVVVAFKIADDGTLLYEDPNGEMSSTIVLRRQ